MAWLHSRAALIIEAVVALILSYAAGSRALDTGSYWEYLACVVFLGFGIKFIAHVFRKRHEPK